MTKQAKSDEEIRAIAKSYRGDGATADELAAHEVGFRQAEEMYLPIINQQAGEIEELKAENRKLTSMLTDQEQENQQLQSRFDELTKENERLNRVANGLSIALDNSIERIMQTDSRFDEMVKGLEAIPSYGQGDIITGHRYIPHNAVQSLVSKAKGEANGKV